MIGAHMEPWRIISSIKHKESKGISEKMVTIKEYKTKVELNLSNICEAFFTSLTPISFPLSSLLSPRFFMSR
jgi:14-3-3 protein epsilon